MNTRYDDDRWYEEDDYDRFMFEIADHDYVDYNSSIDDWVTYLAVDQSDSDDNICNLHASLATLCDSDDASF